METLRIGVLLAAILVIAAGAAAVPLVSTHEAQTGYAAVPDVPSYALDTVGFAPAPTAIDTGPPNAICLIASVETAISAIEGMAPTARHYCDAVPSDDLASTMNPAPTGTYGVMIGLNKASGLFPPFPICSFRFQTP